MVQNVKLIQYILHFALYYYYLIKNFQFLLQHLYIILDYDHILNEFLILVDLYWINILIRPEHEEVV